MILSTNSFPQYVSDVTEVTFRAVSEEEPSPPFFSTGDALCIPFTPGLGSIV